MFNVAEIPTQWGSDKIVKTTLLQCMGDEVKACNEAKGWYDVSPRVQEFAEWYEEEFGHPPTEKMIEGLTKVFGPRTFGDDISLLHSEVSEMLEAFRDHGLERITTWKSTPNSQSINGMLSDFTDEDLLAAGYVPKPDGVGAEAADVLVRLLDTCSRYGIDLFAEWRRKVDFNWTRPTRHGGKAM